MSSSDVASIDYLVQSVTLRSSLPLCLHGYVLPFIALYSLWLGAWFSGAVGSAYELFAIGVVVVALLQALTALSCLWSVSVRCALTTRCVRSPQRATLVQVVPTENNGGAELVPLQRRSLASCSHRNQSDSDTVFWFRFQKAKYIWSADRKCFDALRFPDNNVLGEYTRWRGHETEEAVKEAELTYGRNMMDLDVPEFMELFKERASAPFFVFQVFCVGLWCLDEYWYYSIFTLMMLVVFECTLVYQQMRNMSEIHNMGNKAFRVHVYRCGKWRPLVSDQLVPGDLVSIIRSKNAVPCDMLLVRGSCIVDEAMLTGESIPQMKEAAELGEQHVVLDAEINGRLHVLYGGTRVVQHTTPIKTADTVRAADKGCVGYVLRTGFATSQGKLLRTIMYGVKRVTANNKESFGFILFLLVFALAAAWHLWSEGSRNPDRNRYKLFLECTLILTSVIPPELPIELSLAVNNSLISLVRLYVFCTEPFRIPFGGKVDICCFDKTGTLTTDNLVVEGVAGLNHTSANDGVKNVSDDKILPLSEVPETTVRVLATCHSLAQLDDGLVGDPLEKAILNAVDWNLTKSDAVVPRQGRMPGMKIFQRFHFSSSLKRMSVLAGYTAAGSVETNHIVAVKGAPETLKLMYDCVPDNYDLAYLCMTRRGARVLALGYRDMRQLSAQSIKELTRDDIECHLQFAGFVVVSCPLKADSGRVIAELTAASHQVTMITGDSALTACHVADRLNFTRHDRVTLILSNSEGRWLWQSIDQSVSLPLVAESWPKFFAEHNVCLTGDALAYLQQQQQSTDLLRLLIPRTRVFARVAPKQKEFIITSLRRYGFTTLMCGDGTNDVGALKHAHVGVAIMANAPLVAPARRKMARASGASSTAPPLAANNSTDAGAVVTRNRTGGESSNVARRGQSRKLLPRGGGDSARHAQSAQAQQPATLQDMMLKLQEQQQDEEKAQMVRLGDASIAAPFSSKLSSINCVCNIIKQGRCTLVTTLQMFKILALNALVLAYSQSVLYLDGVKFSDGQATLQGILLALSFLFISRSQPLRVLSAQRPLPNIFNLYTILTVLLQFCVHFLCLVFLISEAKQLMPPLETEFVDPEKEFEPNTLNSAVYIVSMSLQLATFAINYRGHPFMESLAENRMLLYSLAGSALVVLTLALGVSDDLSEQFSVVQFPDQFRQQLVSALFVDISVAYLVDRVLRFIFDRAPLAAELKN